MSDDNDVEAIEAALSSVKKHVIKAKDLLSSGSTMLNLAATGRPNGCFAKGHYYWIVGDSDSGKTFLTLTCLAEACINPNFDDYDIIFDNGEDGALMDIERFFGPRLVERIRPPAGTKNNPKYSATIEELYYNFDDAVKRGKPFIYLQDSIDALDTKDDEEKFEQQKRAYRSGKKGKAAASEDGEEGGEAKTTGTYGTAKAKLNSRLIKRVIRGCRDLKSIAMFISQTRDNIGFGARFNPSTVSGGKALKFYATLQIWTSPLGKIRKDIRGKKRQLGIVAKVQLRKNRITGRDRTVQVPIYHSVGIDDIGGMVDYLVDEKHWGGKFAQGQSVCNTVEATEFDYAGPREKLVRKIQEEERESELKTLVKETWNDIEEACKVQRKSKYA